MNQIEIYECKSDPVDTNMSCWDADTNFESHAFILANNSKLILKDSAEFRGRFFGACLEAIHKLCE